MTDKKFSRDEYIIKLDGCLNFRDLGGYKCENGKIFATGKFYRSDSLSKLTDNDVQTLLDKGITAVVDLRADNELRHWPNRIAIENGFIYRNISLFDGVYNADLDDVKDVVLSELYVKLIEISCGKFIEALRFFIENKDRASVFHCTLGKDRTGITAMLLHSIAGVSEEDILRDYEVTFSYMLPEFEITTKAFSPEEKARYYKVLASDPKNLKHLLDFIKEKYGSVEEMLIQKGMEKSELDSLKTIIWK